MYQIDLWDDYLLDLLGHDEFGKRQVAEVKLIAETLLDNEIDMIDKIDLLDWVAKLDSKKQLFLLPQLVQLFSYRSPILDDTLLRLINELLDDNHQSLCEQFEQFCRDESSNGIEDILSKVFRLINDCVLPDLGVGLRGLKACKNILFYVGLLSGLASTFQNRAEHDRLKDYVEDDEQELCRKSLLLWLSRGPVYVRFQILEWITQCNIDLDDGVSLADLLLSIYVQDTSPVVAAKAIECYAKVVDENDVKQACEIISNEITSFTLRPLNWQYFSSTKAIQTISVGQLNALFTIVNQNIERPEIAKYLRRFLAIKPTSAIAFDKDKHKDKQAWRKTLNTSMLLLGQRLLIKASYQEGKGSLLLGNGVFIPKNKIVDNRRFLARVKGRAFLWVRPLPNENESNALEWQFETIGLAYQNSKILFCHDLNGLVAPKINWDTQRHYDVKQLVELRKDTSFQFSTRAPWIIAAIEFAVEGISYFIKQNKSLADDLPRELLSFIKQLAITSVFWFYDRSNVGAAVNKFKDLVKSLLINRLNNEQIFDVFFELDNINANSCETWLLGSMANTVINVKRDLPEANWINCNIRGLQKLAACDTADKSVARYIGPAAVALYHRAVDDFDRQRTLIADFKLDPAMVFDMAANALSLLTDEQFLQTLECHKDKLTSDILVAPSSFDHNTRLVVLWAEYFARGLTDSHLVCDDLPLSKAAYVCSTDMTYFNRYNGITTPIRLRLLAVLKECYQQCELYTDLLGRLIRTASPGELDFYFSLNPTLDDIHFKWLATVLNEQRKWQQVQRVHEIKGLFVKRQIILTKLLKAPFEEPFYNYLKSASKPLPVSANSAYAIGQLQSVEYSFAEQPSQATLFNAVDDVDIDLHADAQLKVTPSFVVNPTAQSQFECIAKFQPTYKNTINFHQLRLPIEQKRQLLQQHILADGTIYVVGKVINKRGLIVEVDLGVDLTFRLNRIQALNTQQLEGFEDNGKVIVALDVQQRKQVVTELYVNVLTDEQVLEEKNKGTQVINFESINNATQELIKKWQACQIDSKQGFLIKGKVLHSFQTREGKKHYLYQSGFGVWRDNQFKPPMFMLKKQDFANGDSVILKPLRVKYEQLSITRALANVSASAMALPTNIAQYVQVTAIEYSEGEGWYADYNGQKFNILRQHLTVDIQKLWYLESRATLVLDGGATAKALGNSHLNIIDGFVARELSDLLVAVNMEELNCLTLVKWNEFEQAFVFETGQFEYDEQVLENSEADTLFGLLGGLITLKQGELLLEDGSPVTKRDLVKYVRYKIEVVSGYLSPAGKFVLDIKSPKLYLRIIERDEKTIRLQAQYSADKEIEVINTTDGLQLVDWFADDMAGLAPLTIVNNDSDSKKYNNNKFYVSISKGWMPFDEHHQITVKTLDSRQLNWQRTPNFLSNILELKKGSVVSESSPYFISLNMCYVDNFPLTVSPIAQLLYQPIVDSKQLNRYRFELPLPRVTQIQSFKPQSLTFLNLKNRNVQQSLANIAPCQGVVVKTPYKNAANKQVTVRWLLKKNSGVVLEDTLEGVYQYNDSTKRHSSLYNGDIVQVTKQRGQFELVKKARRVVVNPLACIFSIADWRKKVKLGSVSIKATLVKRGSGSQPWLFVFETGHMVSVIDSNVVFATDLNLDDLWKGDIVTLAIEQNNNLLQVTIKAFEYGCLHQYINKSIAVRFVWYDWQTQTISGHLVLHDIDGLMIPINMATKDLPASINPAFIDKTEEHQLYLSNYYLNLVPLTNDGVDISLQVKLTDELTVEAQLEDLSQAMLGIDVLHSQEGVLSQSAQGKTTVELVNLNYEKTITVKPEELCWVQRHHLSDVDQSSRKITIYTEDDDYFGSLRREPPLLLANWLKIKSSYLTPVVVNETLYFYGPLDENVFSIINLQREGFIDECQNITDWYLFESNLGQTIIVHQSQMLILGNNYERDRLKYGDRVKRFETFSLAAVYDQNADEDDTEFPESGLDRLTIGINILEVQLDVLHEVEAFDENGGLYFGRIAKSQGGFKLLEMRGRSYANKAFDDKRLKGWQLHLKQSDELLKRLHNEAKHSYYYLKYHSVNREKQTIYMQVVANDDVVVKNNYIFVRCTGFGDYGESAKLNVETLDGNHDAELFIPETLFSVRRGMLKGAERFKDRIFLAKVIDENTEAKFENSKPWRKLSLLDGLPRPYTHLMKGFKSQVIVCELLVNALVVEAEPGVQVNIELSRLQGNEQQISALQRGDVVILSRDINAAKLVITGVIKGQRHYLPEDKAMTLQTKLWSTPKSRQERAVKQRNSRFESDILGFEQLIGSSALYGRLLNEQKLIYQTLDTTKATTSFIALELGAQKYSFYGKLDLVDISQPLLELGNGHKLPVSWSQLTFKEGNTTKLANAINALEWFDGISGDDKKNISNTLVIAQKLQSVNEPSFTFLAKYPFPVEFLILQFTKQNNKAKTYVVAGWRDKELILEVGIGLYCVLPFDLIALNGQAYFNGKRYFDASIIDTGDSIKLQMVSDDEHYQTLPDFKILSITTGNTRHFKNGLHTVIERKGGGNNQVVRIGSKIIDSRIDDLFTDHVFDLRQLEIKRRLPELLKLAHNYGSRLILKAEVDKVFVAKTGFGVVVDIGYRLMKDNGGDLVFFTENSGDFKAGDAVTVRVTNFQFEEDGKLTGLTCFPVDLSELSYVDRRYVRLGCNHRFEINQPYLKFGDVVVLSLNNENKHKLQVLGFEQYEVVWQAESSYKKLQLTQQNLIDYLNMANAGPLWATVKSVDFTNKKIVVNEYKQHKLVLPSVIKVSIARVVGQLDERQLLVSIGGVPFPIDICALGYGFEQLPKSLLSLAIKNQATFCVTFDKWRLCAKAPFKPPAKEFDGLVKLVSEDGLIIEGQGFHAYVPANELAYCQLDEQLIRKLFTGKLLRIARVWRGSKADIYSLIANKDIKADLWALQNGDGVIHVKPESVLADDTLVVSTEQGLLLPLIANKDGIDKLYSAGKTFIAYLNYINIAEQFIELSITKRKSQKWDLPLVGSLFKSERLFGYNLNYFTSNDVEAFELWFNKQNSITSSIDRWKMVIDYHFRFDKAVALCESLGYGLKALWPQFVEVSSNCMAKEHTKPIDDVELNFAVGYWLLLNGDYQQALSFLDAAIDIQQNQVGQDSFVLMFARLYAQLKVCDVQPISEQTNEGVMPDNLPLFADNLQALVARLWVNALHTIPLSFNMFESQLQIAVAEALSINDTNKACKLLRESSSHSTTIMMKLISDIYVYLLSKGKGYGAIEKSGVDLLAKLVDDLILKINESKALQIDTDVLCVAIKLSFARGDVKNAWHLLRKVSTEHQSSSGQILYFWKTWLEGLPFDVGNYQPLDSRCELLVTLNRTYELVADETSRGNTVDKPELIEHMDNIWQLVKSARFDWWLPKANYIATTPKPVGGDELKLWRLRFGIK